MGFEDLVTKEDIEALKKLIASTLQNVRTEDEPWLNMKEAAAYIKDKPKTLGNKVRAGEIPYIRDGRLVKFRRADLDRYMMDRRVSIDNELVSKAFALGAK